MTSAAIVLTAACAVAVVGLLAAEWSAWRRARITFKLLASSAFVAVACVLPGSASAYGRLVIVALALSWVGDACLLSSRAALFLAGLAAFLLAHLVFAAAFAQGALDGHALLAALLVMLAVGGVTMRWLWPHLSTPYKAAVGAYVAAIVGMCALAVARSAALGYWPLAVGALGFAASDLAVARDRFVAPGRVNRLWGLPLYYASQLILAWSVASRGGL